MFSEARGCVSVLTWTPLLLLPIPSLVLKPGVVDGSFRERFKIEAQATSKLNHPNIVTVHDFGIDGDVPFLVLEKLEGCSLRDELTRLGPLKVDRTRSILRDIAGALSTAHAMGVIHRDLKPENVFLARRLDGTETVKVLDFGIAKILDVEGNRTQTDTGVVPGTPVREALCDAKTIEARGPCVEVARRAVYGFGDETPDLARGEVTLHGLCGHGAFPLACFHAKVLGAAGAGVAANPLGAIELSTAEATAAADDCAKGGIIACYALSIVREREARANNDASAATIRRSWTTFCQAGVKDACTRAQESAALLQQ